MSHRSCHCERKAASISLRWRSGAATIVGNLRNRRLSKSDTGGFKWICCVSSVAILLPPLGVFLQVGIGKHFWINVLLTILGYIPGIIHAVWVIAKY
jgi:uncharacterized membrane protein YqaE (UPF0057 family)